MTYQVPTKLGLTRSLFVPDKPTSLAGSPIQNHKMWHPKFRFGQSGIKLHTQHISLRSRMSNVARGYQDIAEQKHQGQSKFIGSKLVWNWVFWVVFPSPWQHNSSNPKTQTRGLHRKGILPRPENYKGFSHNDNSNSLILPMSWKGIIWLQLRILMTSNLIVTRTKLKTKLSITNRQNITVLFDRSGYALQTWK